MISKETYLRNMQVIDTYIENISKSENDINKIRELLRKKADELNIKYRIRKDGSTEIIHPDHIPEYQEIKVTKEVIVPRIEKQSSCDIAILSKNFKDQMLGAIEYTNNTDREVHYTLCDTHKGKRLTTPSFGSRKSVSPPQGKCKKEFGNSSREVAEFHTHPKEYENFGGFSGADLISFYDTPEDKVNCVVKEVKIGHTKNIRVRCAKTRDVKNFVGSLDWKLSKNITDKNVNEFMSAIDTIDERKQEKFSCFVDFPIGSKFKDISQLKKEQKKKSPSLYKKLYG